MISDVLIIGGGVIGLAVAIELKLRGAGVTIVSRDFHAAATHAAAGMLAPGAEIIPNGAMQELCQRSMSLYSDWTRKLEEFTSINTGYWSCGILSPVYEDAGTRGHGDTGNQEDAGTRGHGDTEKDSSPRPRVSPFSASSSPAYWLDKEVIHQYQPGLGAEVVGGWWYPEDAQVDNRALAQALLAAAKTLGVELKEGVTVEGIQQQQRYVLGVQTNVGVLRAEHYVFAVGAWSNILCPLPVHPRKGQMLSVRIPEFVPDLPSLTRVLLGKDIYIVLKAR